MKDCIHREVSIGDFVLVGNYDHSLSIGKVVEIGTDCIRVKMSNDVISRIDEYDFFILSPEQITEYLINK